MQIEHLQRDMKFWKTDYFIKFGLDSHTLYISLRVKNHDFFKITEVNNLHISLEFTIEQKQTNHSVS